MTTEFHEFANLFPMMDGKAYEDLVDDIRDNGVHEPIVTYEGKILDGRNRHLASRQAGVDCPQVEYSGDDPRGFVVSLNLKRRHLSESQRAMVAAKLADMPQGARTDIKPSANLRNVDAAKMLNVSSRSVETAKAVHRDGTPELVKAVETGKISVSAAKTISKQDEDTQRRLAAEDRLGQSVAELRKLERELEEVEKLPKAKPLTAKEIQDREAIFGTAEDRQMEGRIYEILDLVAAQPSPREAVSRISPATAYAIDTTKILDAAAWLSDFCEAWVTRAATTTNNKTKEAA